ncbi:hypothetical protein ACFLXU_05225 [Chloroflexota bacterium]
MNTSNRAEESVQEWELVNPEGVKQPEVVKLNPHLGALEGKTVVLTWNRKPNGDVFLSRVAELLAKEVKDVKIIKHWEIDPHYPIPGPDPAGFGKQLAATVLEYKPDIVINGQGD